MTPEAQLAAFLDKYSPEIRTLAKAARRKMRTMLPGAIELVYDNYNALVVGYGPTERASDAVFSIVMYPGWVTLFFLDGKGLPDPAKLLKGDGKQVRHVVLDGVATLDMPEVRNLMNAALERSETPIDPKQRRRLVIKSISAKQRPRRPVLK